MQHGVVVETLCFTIKISQFNQKPISIFLQNPF